jgi:glycosyltransferase involved in cell wall biosynthesis
LFVGRAAREKGLAVLLEAWSRTGLEPPRASLVLVGAHGQAAGPRGWSVHAGYPGVFALGELGPHALRDVYAGSDVLVVPSIATREFREPWGLVVNEAMNRRLAVIASDAVGAAAGGLVRDGETGLVVPAGDPGALAQAIFRLTDSAHLRARLGAAGAEAVATYSHETWAEGFSLALASLGLTATRARW